MNRSSSESKKALVIVCVFLAGLVVGFGIRHLLSSPPRPATRSPVAGPALSPSDTVITEFSEPAASPSPTQVLGGSPGQDAPATVALILEARRRGDAETVANWSTPEAAVQLSSYPPDAFDPALTTCAPDPLLPDSDVVCILKPRRVPIAEASARLRQTGEGYRLILVAPFVD